LVDTTADAAFALLLAAARRVAEGDRFIREGHWRPDSRWSLEFFLGKDVSGATLGIIGLGAIGQAVARRAVGFDMRVIGWTPSGRAVPGVENVSLEELLLRSDFVSVHWPSPRRTIYSTPKDRHHETGAVLVMQPRRYSMNERALAQALDSGHIYAAGLMCLSASRPWTARCCATPESWWCPYGSATNLTRAK
jgi:glyoxylate reductase